MESNGISVSNVVGFFLIFIMLYVSCFSNLMKNHKTNIFVIKDNYYIFLYFKTDAQDEV